MNERLTINPIIEREKVLSLLTPELHNESQSAINFLSLIEQSSPSLWEEIKFLRTLAIMDFAKIHSPFYRKFWKGIDFRTIKTPEELSQLPVVTKDDLIHHTQQWNEQKDSGVAFPQTDFMTRPPIEGYSFWYTGGSTGYRTISIRGKDEWDLYVNTAGRMIGTRYYSPGEMVGVLINPASGWSGAQVFGEIIRRTPGIGSTQLYMTDGRENVLRTMIDSRTTSLFTQPENMIHPQKGLIPLILENPDLRGLFRKIVYGGSPLSPHEIKFLEEQNFQVRPIYSQTEAGPIGIVPFDMPLIFDEEGNIHYLPTPLNFFLIREVEGQLRIVVTNLIYTVAPVVAYENRDMAVWTDETHNGLPLFKFYGRIPEDVVIGSLKIKNTHLIDPILQSLKDLEIPLISPQVQLIEREGRVYTLRLVIPNLGLTDEQIQIIRERVINSLKKTWDMQNMGEDFNELMTYITGVEISSEPGDIREKPGTGKVYPFCVLLEKNK